MAHFGRNIALPLLMVAAAACSSGRGQAPPQPPVQPEPEPAADDAGTDDPSSEASSSPPPPGARQIRELDWRGVDCRGGSTLGRILRLGFDSARGWACQVSSVRFADLTGDQVEEAIVEMEFQLTAIDQRAGGGTSERRIRSEEHAVVALRDGRPQLLVHVVNDQGDITAVDVVDGGLRIELQGCWECGCDLYHEYWVWQGGHFVTDEERSRQVYEAPSCTRF